MSGFDPAWLALREPYDHAARDADLTETFVAALEPSPELIDLGCGSGSNLRFLAPHLPVDQRWTCVDHDRQLLKHLEASKPLGVEVSARVLDLAQGLDHLAIRRGMSITAAALLDLASASWLDHLARHCSEVALLMTLSFDGRIIWKPDDPSDAAITSAFCRHQRLDKGFGPALGPDAAAHFAEQMRQAGHHVRLAPSDWVFGGEDTPILEAMIEGILAAAGEIDPSLPIASWRARRRQEIDSRQLSLTVGHLDLLALPCATWCDHERHGATMSDMQRP